MMKHHFKTVIHIITAFFQKNGIKKGASSTRTQHQYIAHIGNAIIAYFPKVLTTIFPYVIFYCRGCYRYENNSFL